MRETLFTLTTTDLISVLRDMVNVRCAVAFDFARTQECGIFDNSEEAKWWPDHPAGVKRKTFAKEIDNLSNWYDRILTKMTKC